MEQLGSHWTDFGVVLYVGFLLNSVTVSSLVKIGESDTNLNEDLRKYMLLVFMIECSV
jgi:hypothetical protein